MIDFAAVRCCRCRSANGLRLEGDEFVCSDPDLCAERLRVAAAYEAGELEVWDETGSVDLEVLSAMMERWTQRLPSLTGEVPIVARPKWELVRRCNTCGVALGGHFSGDVIEAFDAHHLGHDVERFDDRPPADQALPLEEADSADDASG